MRRQRLLIPDPEVHRRPRIVVHVDARIVDIVAFTAREQDLGSWLPDGTSRTTLAGQPEPDLETITRIT